MSEWKTPTTCSFGDCGSWKWEDGNLHIRSTLHPNQIVTLTPAEATDFLAAVKAGELG